MRTLIMPFLLHWPWAFAAALLIVVATCAITVWRRLILSRRSAGCFAAGLGCLALAAGGLSSRIARPADVTVMVDLSPSTRGASYRSRAWLQERLRQLLGDAPHRILFFADQNADAVAGDPLPDLPAGRTRFLPPAAGAVILFSDGQFDPPPIAPPIFPVIDPMLEHVSDAAVVNVEQYNVDELSIHLRNISGPRTLRLNGAIPATLPVGDGDFFLPAKIDPAGSRIEARLTGGDRWPENDAIKFAPAPSTKLEHWWVGGSQSPPGWHHEQPADLPTAAANYLDPSIIVLDDVSAESLSPIQRDRLLQYVRDLGGGLIIFGGTDAFAAGGYQGTPIEALSPLASNPPLPASRWMVLVDSSGSMNQDAGGATRWQKACASVAGVLPSLPPADSVLLGSFAKDLHWWVQDQPARSLKSMSFPPGGITPGGPTNLAAVLSNIAAASKAQAIPTQLVLITDGQTKINSPSQLAQTLRAAGITVSLLSIGQDPPDGALVQVINRTAGKFIATTVPNRRNWTAALRQLVRGISAKPLSLDRILPHFSGPLTSLIPVSINRWNRTWLKPRADRLASASHVGIEVPLIGTWHFGVGVCTAAAYQPDPATIAALVKLTATPPRDPRFAVSWTIDSKISVQIDARYNGALLNGLNFRLVPSNASADKTIPQTAPGQYALEIDRPPQPVIFTIRQNGRILDRRAIPSLYPVEFQHIGINRANLANLARRTGGRIIEPGDRRRIVLPETRLPFSLTSLLALLGGAMLAAGLVLARRG